MKMATNETFNLLIGVTGSVATIKLIELTQRIHSMFPISKMIQNSDSNSTIVNVDIKIKIVMTEHSKHFVLKEDLNKAFIDKNIDTYEDSDEWLWKNMTDPVLHIELRKWANLFLIAPLDANTLGKISNGICDNLLTCIVRAWDISRPLLYCPAMNVHMYNHPLTKEHMLKLKSFGYICIEPVEKMLACGDFGIGGMASVDTITNKVIDYMFKKIT